MSTSEAEESFHGFAEAGPEETMVVSIAKELALGWWHSSIAPIFSHGPVKILYGI